MIDTTSGDYDYTYLSLGAGVQSSALLVLACTDERVPTPDVAIFADTGDEPASVYDYLEILTDWAKPFGVDVLTTQKGVLSDACKKGFVPVPIYTANPDGSTGILRRQCTREYKIAPITKKVRELLGYEPRYKVKESVRAMLGISLDEIQRMKESRFKWVTNCFPLVDLEIKRSDCYKIITEVGLPNPTRSACVYCPYHSDSEWKQMKDQSPREFEKAVQFDRMIRYQTKKGSEQLNYIHKSMTPLSEVVFNIDDPNQVDMFNSECEGMCGL